MLRRYAIGSIHSQHFQRINWRASIANRSRLRRASHTPSENGPVQANGRKQEFDEEREFFHSVLNASTTKRDAKSYISRFSPKPPKYNEAELVPSSHIALIKLRLLQSLSDVLVDGLVRTISQLTRLGMRCIIIIDAEHVSPDEPIELLHSHEIALAQADRLVSALEKVNLIRANRLENLFSIPSYHEQVSPTVRIRGQVEVQFPEMLSRFLNRGIIPVIPPIAFTEDTQRMVDVAADEVVLAITRELAGLRTWTSPHKTDQSTQPKYTLDRMIILDPVGAMPSAKRSNKFHIFLNMEQEYESEKRELLQQSSIEESEGSKTNLDRHLLNLDLLRNTLALLPPSSSALLTTPEQAATPAVQETTEGALGVQTRRPKNPLIYNLLTDKPLVSSSLPAARMTQENDIANTDALCRPTGATFAKRGMPLTMIPDPDLQVWQPPKSGEKQLSLQDPRIDFPRLLNLIEDSFNRPLDVGHYVDRIRNKIAGIIVAGEYEGGAILTWELPPGVPDDGSESSRQRMVPYLDKFAVLKRSQGAGGVADIVFSAMVRSCFPDGVCWRSRRDNPVNKWYFERSVGTWKIPSSNWTMFWTKGDLLQGSQQWHDYEAVCRTVVPSWADNQNVLD